MSFDESAITRLRRYREEADRSLKFMHETEDVARRYAERLFAGLEYMATLGRQAGFEVETALTGELITLSAAVEPGTEARVAFGLVRGAAAETDEDLMHEELSRYSLKPSGYSGRILGWSETAGTEPCQTFAVYRDGVWKTKGLFVARARGRVDDPNDVIHGFCLRILGRLIDLSALTGGAGHRWSQDPYTLTDLADGMKHPVEVRWSR